MTVGEKKKENLLFLKRENLIDTEHKYKETYISPICLHQFPSAAF